MKQLLLLVLLVFAGVCTKVSAQLPSYQWSATSNANSGGYVMFQENATDRWNNSYVTGFFYYSATFGPYTLTADGLYDAFVAKLDSAGNYLWVRQIGGADYDMGYSVAVDTSGNVFAVGYFSSEVVFKPGDASTKRTASGYNDLYIVKYDENGTFQWVSAIGGVSCEKADGVTTDREGNVYITGNFSDLVFFGNTAIPVTSAGGRDGFVCKLKANNGVAQWARKMGSSAGDYGNDVTVDDNGNVYVAGYYTGSSMNVYNAGSSIGTSLTNSTGSSMTFVSKYDANGTAQWSKNIAPLDNSYFWAYTGCYYYNWGYYEYTPSIATDGYGGLYLGGSFSSPFSFGSYSLTPKGKSDIYVCRMDLNGNVEWLKSLSSKYYDVCYDISADVSSNLYIAGSIPGHDSIQYGGAVLNPMDAVNPTNDVMLAKLDLDGNAVWGIRGHAGYAWWYNDYYSYNFLTGVSANEVGGIYTSGFFYGNSWDPQTGNTLPTNLKFRVNNDTDSYGGVINNWWYVSHLTKFQQNEYIITGKLAKTGYCPGDTVKIPFYARGPFTAQNKFEAHMSDPKGGFLNATTIGSKVSDQNGYDTLYAVIPAGTPYGNGYMFRVVSTKKMLRGNTNGRNVVVGVPKPKMGTDVTICLGDSAKLTVTQSQGYRWLPNSAAFNLADTNKTSIWVKPIVTTDLIGYNKNNYGCIDFDTIRVTVVPRVVPNAGPDAYVCYKDTIKLKATGGISYKWTPSYGLSADNVPDPKCFTDSTIMYKVAVNNGACTETDSVMISALKPLAVSIAPVGSPCAGTSVTLRAIPSGGRGVGNYYFTWSNGMKGDSITVPFDTTETISVTLTDSCSRVNATDSYIVNVLAALDITGPNNTTICYGGLASLGSLASGGKSNRHVVHWYDLRRNTYEGIGFLKKVSPLDTTTYMLVLTDSCTLRPDTAYVTVNVKPKLEVKISSDTFICYGGTATLTAATFGGNPANHVISWLHDGSTSNSIQVSPLTTTQYIVKLSDGCSVPDAYDTITVTVGDPLKVTLPATETICLGQTIQLQAKGAGGYDSTQWQYSWDDGAHIGFNYSVSPTTTTTYKVKLTDGCTAPADSASITVIVRDVLSLDISSDTTMCQGVSRTMRVVPKGGYPSNYSISWDNGLGTGDEKTVSPATTTVYTVVLDDGCSAPVTKQITITIIPTPQLAFDAVDTAICPGTPIQFINTTTGTGGPYTYRWDFGDGESSTDFSPAHKYALPGTYTVSLYAKGTGGCDATLVKNDYITIYPVPVARFAVEPKETDLNDTKISYTSTSVGASKYIWTLSDGTVRTDVNSFRHEYKDTGNYYAKLVVLNSFGCADSLSDQMVRIRDVFTVFVPSAFTANGDSKNEVFNATFTGAVEVRLLIFNRWGQVVHDGNSMQAGWDGTGPGGQDLPQDTYMYQFIVKDLKNRMHNVYGTVILLR